LIPIRDNKSSYLFPWVTVILIALNVAVFFFQLSLSDDPSLLVNVVPWREQGVTFGDYEGLSAYDRVRISPRRKFIFRFGLVPGELTSFSDLPPKIGLSVFFTLLSSMFLHGGLLHLGGNMLFLWIFGDNVEEAMGRFKFLLFYLLSGMGGALFQILTHLKSGVPMIGASGAIAGVMGAYFLLYPGSRILTIVPLFFFFTFVEIPALILLGLWFFFQLMRGLMGAGAEVAFLAHVGGFIVGALLTPYFKRRNISIELFRYF